MKASHIIQLISSVIVFSILITSILFAKHVKDKAKDLGQGANALYEELSQINTEASLPGAQAMQRAREFLENGENTKAREKLLFVTNFYSNAPFATQARGILGEMNLDVIFSREILKNKKTYEIQRGDSLSKIADEFSCTPEYIIALNGLTHAHTIHPGQEIMVMPLKLKVVIDAQKKTLTLLRDEQFLKEYPLLDVVITGKNSLLETTVSKALGYSKTTTYPRSSNGYLQNKKMILLKKGNLIIREIKHPDESDPGSGFFLSSSDMEELSLFIKSGDPVEIQL